jgi:hypothetical protein
VKDDRPVLAASVVVASFMLLVVLAVLAFVVLLDPIP